MAISDLAVSFSGVQAVDGLSMTVPTGTVTVVLGPNGAGKTTTINTCLGLTRPAAGTVRVLDLDPVIDAAVLRPRVGVLLQDGGIPAASRPREIVTHFAALSPHPHPVEALLARLGLDGLDRAYRRLSGGEQQRVKLAVAMVGRPHLLILDEPTTGMDPAARREFWTLMDQLRSAGATVLLTTHQPDEAATRADQVVVVHQGRVVRSGTPAQLIEESPVWFSAARHLDLTGLRSALSETVRVQEVEPGRYRVTGTLGAPEIATLQSWSAQHHDGRSTLNVVRSLEEAYLALTGDPRW